MEKEKIVPDTSVIIDGRITQIAREQKVKILIPEAVVAELEHQANAGKESGLDGLAELSELIRIADVEFLAGSAEDGIKPSRLGGMDALIREAARQTGATLVTSDSVQARVAEVLGVSVEYMPPKVRIKEPGLFKLFDETTMSVHIKEGTSVYAKKGTVGKFELVEIGGVLKRDAIEQYAKEIVEYARSSADSYMEIERSGATVVQSGQYRIVIARPPFSDGMEITAVKPLVKTRLEDYKLSGKLLNRLDERAEGVFVAGPPGAGKSTFACSLADHYHSKGKIVKTMEQPRDLQVSDEITQYGPLEGSMEKTSDILLLVRPDYTIYDEVRKTEDFRIFADLRLAGVGMVGVTHASKPIDAIQRLIGRVELGVIPHIVDTMIFVKAGRITKVYELSMKVKVPFGMREQDLARPVVEVRDFETGIPEYELYSYGEEVVVIPVDETSPNIRVRSRHNEVSITKSKKTLTLMAHGFHNRHAKIFADDVYIATERANAAGRINISRNTEAARILIDALNSEKKIILR